MKLNDVEEFAVQMLFNGDDPTSVAVRAQLTLARVLDRRSTGVGFFSRIYLEVAVPIPVLKERDWNFEHPHLSHGGSFMCWLESTNSIELEAVVHDGEWPNYFNPNDFKEL